MDESRELFEEWVKSDIDRMITMQCPIYKGIAFSAWQASRAVEIDLPDELPSSRDWQAGYNQCLEDCRDEITNAGYKFKE